jgi:TonB-linked SusC/RagA family outer membrane protein
MNIKNIIQYLFISIVGILSTGELSAQIEDTTAVNSGYVENENYTSDAVGVAKASDLAKISAINPKNALYGQIPGLSVLQNGGDWWAQDPNFLVRGQSNFGSYSAPLVLVDGFERSLSAITISEIQSISVLKDASATAIYGQRGANGVIMVTTKRGLAEGMKVDFSYERSVNQPFRMPEMLDAYGYASAMNEALQLDGQESRYSRLKLDAYNNGTFPIEYPNVNWFKEVLRQTAFTDNVNATFQGGEGKTRYFVSLNYLGGEGLLKHDRNTNDYSTQLEYQRANIRTNLDISLSKSTMLKFNLMGRISGTNNPGVSNGNQIFAQMYGIPAGAHAIQNANGTWGGTSVYNQNPVMLVNETGFATSHERTFYADLTLTQDLDIILKGLSISGSASFDNNVDYRDWKTKSNTYFSRTGEIDEINNRLYDVVVRGFGENTALSAGRNFGGQLRHTNAIGKLNYDKQWGKHKLNAMTFAHANTEVGMGMEATYHRINLAGKINYVYDNKYIADISMSRSANNVLPEGKKFASYPALSLAWVASNEGFLSGSSLVNFLKLRASAGLSGLEQREHYLHVRKFDYATGYVFANSGAWFGGFAESRRANPEIYPEKSMIANVGLDAELFGGLSLNVDAFYEERSNILVSEWSSTTQTIGVPATSVVNGVVENKGIEVGALWSQEIGDFNYSIGANYSFTRNKIIEQNEQYRDEDYQKRTGLPVGQIFGLEDNGFWGVDDGLNGIDNISPDGVEYTYTSVLRPGDVKYIDKNGDKKIDEFDEAAIGKSWLPEIYYSFTLNAEYKGFGVNALFQGIANASTMLNTEDIFWPLYNNNNISTFSNDRWTPSNAETATLPRLTPEKNKNNYRYSTVWLRDISYLKLRNLVVYYNLPENIISKAKLSSARVFVRGTNLFSIDKIEIMDPEELRTVYPTLKSYNVGLSIGF